MDRTAPPPASLPSTSDTPSIRPVRLRCNDTIDPVGIDRLPPLLSWELDGTDTEIRQTAWQVVATDARTGATLWDSGKTQSDRTLQIPYGGPALRSRESVIWRVRVWDDADVAGPFSACARFEAGLLHESDWRAKWIGNPRGATDVDHPVPAPCFRREIRLAGQVAQARAYVCGLGYHELTINGSKADDTVLRGAFTRYDVSALYDTYDLTAALQAAGDAAVFGVTLGNGWYNCFTPEVWDFRQAPWRHAPKLRLQVHIWYADGREDVVTSDTQWRVGEGEVRFDGLRNGETIDARHAIPGWDTPGFEDAAWPRATLIRSPGGTLKSFQMPPMRVVRTLRPIAVKTVAAGTCVVDMGENLSGWARVTAQGPAGTEIVLRYSEKIHDDGTIDRSNIDIFVKGGEFQTDRFILAGTGAPETFEPRFTYHGFRYVEVTGYPGVPTVNDFEGRVVHTDLPSRGRFACSDPVVNAIHQATLKATLTNWHGMPTDCPHREKNGWTGDAGLSAEQVLYNHDARTAYAKWLDDFLDAQRPSGQLPGIVPTGGWGFNWGSGPAWDSAMLHICWYLYLYDGDLAALRHQYAGMKQYVAFAEGMLDEGIANFGLGDWCPPVGGAEDHKCPTPVTDTAYVAVDADIVAKAAALLGHSEDAERFAALATRIRTAFCRTFVDMETGEVRSDSQTALSCALFQHMVPDTLRGRVFDRLVAQVEVADRHIDCGILGAKYVMHVLNDMGRADLAHAIAVNPTFPGWGNWIAKGATTLREMWNDESSQNHHMFSDIGAWFYRGLAGILPDPDAPGFRHTVFRPQPVPGMAWAEAAHVSPYGEVSSRWERDAGQPAHITFTVRVPANTRGTFHFPAGMKPTDGGTGDRRFGSGTYRFEAHEI